MFISGESASTYNCSRDKLSMAIGLSRIGLEDKEERRRYRESFKKLQNHDVIKVGYIDPKDNINWVKK